MKKLIILLAAMGLMSAVAFAEETAGTTPAAPAEHADAMPAKKHHKGMKHAKMMKKKMKKHAAEGAEQGAGEGATHN